MHSETHHIIAADGTELCLHERSPPNPDAVAVFVHGATYAGRSVFDPIGHPEYSWLRWASNAGVAAFAVDIRGYGDSERPPDMDVDREHADSPVRASVAVKDVETAIDFSNKRYSHPVHLVGTSWGTMIVGKLLSEREPSDVTSATFYAPVFEPNLSIVDGLTAETMSVSRTVTRSEAQSRWNDQIPVEHPAELRGGSSESDPVFEAFWKTLVSSGQGITYEGENAIVAPNGTLRDLLEAGNGSPVYDPSRIRTPTLVVRGSLDTTSTRADAMHLYDSLGVPDDRSMYCELTGGTHFAHLERRRTALYETVDAFQRRHRENSVDQVS